MLFRSRKELTLMGIKIKLNGGIMPKKATPFDAAYDLYVPEDIKMKSGRQIVDLKFSIELPHGYAAIIQSRSGFSARGIETDYKAEYTIGGYEVNEHYRLDADVLLGLVDEKYRGNVGAILKVRDLAEMETVILKRGTRIAQMRIVEVPQTELVEVEELDMTDNREGGFGHTGTK